MAAKKRGPRGHFAKVDVEHSEKVRKAIELRKTGASYEEIAKKLGYAGKSGAYKAVAAGLKELVREPAEELRSLEAERLDALTKALWPKVKRGDLGAMDRMIRVMERRAKLLGLDVPAVQKITHSVGVALEDINEIRKRMDDESAAGDARDGGRTG